MFPENLTKTRICFLFSALCSLTCDTVAPDRLGGTEAEAESEYETETVIADNVYVLGDEQARGAQIENDFLVFPLAGNENLLALDREDIVVAGPVAGDTGFLRKVLAVEQDDGQIVIQTEQAALVDAIVRGELHDTLNFRDVRRYGIGGEDRIHIGVNVGGRVIFRDPDLSVSISRGNIRFDPDFDLDIDIDDRRLQELTAIARGEFEFEFAAEVLAAGSVAVSRGSTLWRSQPYVFIQWIGIVPVVEVVTVTLYVGFEIDLRLAAEIETGVMAQSEIEAGVLYENGDWQTIASHNFEFEAIGPTFEGTFRGRIRVYLEPRINVLFYGVAGPRFGFQPYALLTVAETPPPPIIVLSGGFRGRVNVSIPILDRSTLLFSAEIFNLERELWRQVEEGEGEAEGEAEGEEGEAEGEEGEAEGECVPGPEICDGRDNDCDSIIDNEPDASVSCQDELFCNGEEICGDGACFLGVPIECDDGVECTVDICWEPARGCSTVAAHGWCEDGFVCTTNQCTPTGCMITAFDHDTCDDDDTCTTDQCASSGCQNELIADACEQWRPVTMLNAPRARDHHTAIWTGSEMIIWGGDDGTFIDDGRRYSPTSNTWSRVADTSTDRDAPDSRTHHTAVWTGSEMIVWGGQTSSGAPTTNTGGQYNPIDDTWIEIVRPVAMPPVGRCDHTAVWTDSEMIISSGRDRYMDWIDSAWAGYTPTDGVWRILPASGITARYWHTAVWTGSEMIIWGGCDTNPLLCPTDFILNNGSRYYSTTNTWSPINTAEPPLARRDHTAIWTGSEMIIWGGYTVDASTNTGGIYNPEANLWRAVNIDEAPPARWGHTATWTGSEMIIWGGSGGIRDNERFNNGGRYNPLTDSWIEIPTIETVSPRSDHTAIWTGSEMIVWGGYNGRDYLNTGGRYAP